VESSKGRDGGRRRIESGEWKVVKAGMVGRGSMKKNPAV
jgi:hypothetical protein